MNPRRFPRALLPFGHGFSLLELLVAMAVMALVALMSWRFIDSAASVSVRGQAVLEPVAALEQFWQLLEQDLQHSLGAEPLAQQQLLPGSDFPFSGGVVLEANPAVTVAGLPLLQLTRDGWANPQQQRRSGLQRVLYVREDAAVLRQAWPERNQPVDASTAQQRIVLEGVAAISLRFFPLQGRDLALDWVEAWPLPPLAAAVDQAPGSGLPMAVSVTLTLDGLGDMERWFMLPGA